MRKYELTYLVSDVVPENDLNKVTGKVTNFVAELGGKVTKEDIWGRRKLAYPIKKQDFATYITLYFQLPADKAIEFEKDLRHIDGIIRQLMMVKDYDEEGISLTAEEIAGTEDISAVIGGEKSFEAVVGETEESKKLMSKREAEETIEEEKAEGASSEPEIVTEPVIEKEPVKAEKPKKEKLAEKVEKPVKEAKVAKKAKPADEAERLSKLNDELDDILKDKI